MKKVISIATILFQIFIAFVTLFVIYIIFALLEPTDYDCANAVGFLIFQLIFGFFLCSVTIVVCIIVGLPIRLIKEAYNWWSKKPYLIFVGVTIGIILLIVSLNFTKTTNIKIDGNVRTTQVPNTSLATSGWFLIAFCLLHFYPLTTINWLKTRMFKR